MTQILVHIGFHKTATTYLQTDVFSNEELCFTAPWQRRAMWARGTFITDHSDLFDPAAVRAAWDADQADLDPSKIRVFSDERLSGTIFGNWRMAAHVPERLHAVFPEARILIGIREQRSMILSSYMQYLRLDGQWRMDEFIRHPDDVRVFSPVMPIDRLQYHRTVAQYHALFGPEKVFVMPFERLVRNRDELVADLEAFLRVDGLSRMPQTRRNRSIGPAGMEFMRRANALIKRPPTVLDGQAGTSRLYRLKQLLAWQIGQRLPDRIQRYALDRIKSDIDARVAGYYAPSNRRLQSLIETDLGRYGYDL